MTRIARCQCGSLRVTVSSEPVFVNLCHCQDCQRRSGVPVTCNAYFPKSDTVIEGETRIYERDAQEGRKLRNYFCPTCGSTVYWTLEHRPELYGIAAGAFNDPNFPPPSVSIWEQSKYAWMEVPADIQHFPQARPAVSLPSQS
jgi:hypothetical protein